MELDRDDYFRTQIRMQLHKIEGEIYALQSLINTYGETDKDRWIDLMEQLNRLTEL